MDYGSLVRDVGAGVGAAAAGLSAARFFLSGAAAITRIPVALERAATALEKTVDEKELLERIQEDRRQMSTTLRVIARDIHELREVALKDGESNSDQSA